MTHKKDFTEPGTVYLTLDALLKDHRKIVQDALRQQKWVVSADTKRGRPGGTIVIKYNPVLTERVVRSQLNSLLSSLQRELTVSQGDSAPPVDAAPAPEPAPAPETEPETEPAPEAVPAEDPEPTKPKDNVYVYEVVDEDCDEHMDSVMEDIRKAALEVAYVTAIFDVEGTTFQVNAPRGKHIGVTFK